MLTIEKLKAFGAETEKGLERCMNNEEFYLRMAEKALCDDRLGLLERSLDSGDLDGAFEAAHALKGMYGNLALTPLYSPAYEITELLRNRIKTDYAPLVSEIRKQHRLLSELSDK